MKTLEKINGTFVRHNWKAVAKGLAEGKTFIVENHGKREAIVVAPDRLEADYPTGFDLDAYFARLKQQPKITLAKINSRLARSPEL